MAEILVAGYGYNMNEGRDNRLLAMQHVFEMVELAAMGGLGAVSVQEVTEDIYEDFERRLGATCYVHFRERDRCHTLRSRPHGNVMIVPANGETTVVPRFAETRMPTRDGWFPSTLQIVDICSPSGVLRFGGVQLTTQPAAQDYKGTGTEDQEAERWETFAWIIKTFQDIEDKYGKIFTIAMGDMNCKLLAPVIQHFCQTMQAIELVKNAITRPKTLMMKKMEEYGWTELQLGGDGAFVWNVPLCMDPPQATVLELEGADHFPVAVTAMILSPICDSFSLWKQTF